MGAHVQAIHTTVGYIVPGTAIRLLSHVTIAWGGTRLRSSMRCVGSILSIVTIFGGEGGPKTLQFPGRSMARGQPRRSMPACEIRRNG